MAARPKATGTASACTGGRRSGCCARSAQAPTPPPRRCATGPQRGRPHVEEADELGRRAVLDQAGDEDAESLDVAPAPLRRATTSPAARTRGSTSSRRRPPRCRRARPEAAGGDQARHGARRSDGYQPDRVLPLHPHRRLRRRAPPRGARQRASRSSPSPARSPPAEREQRVAELGDARRAVLVATDCLSEGINLQEHFDAVVHYDLSWNPTRHEQREGRVDRYGQPQPTRPGRHLLRRDNADRRARARRAATQAPRRSASRSGSPSRSRSTRRR